ncbi:MAG: hypothetical protein PHY75_05420 [Bacteroidales bacterium]|nr:hypothetical protein [Bacteroidales bacterium]
MDNTGLDDIKNTLIDLLDMGNCKEILDGHFSIYDQAVALLDEMYSLGWDNCYKDAAEDFHDKITSDTL